MADEAIDRAMESVHGDVYDDLMDDRNPLSFDQVQKRLADARTLRASVRLLEETAGTTIEKAEETWDAEQRLGLAGIIVRHAEYGVPIPDDLRQRAIAWLEEEEIEWEEATKRQLRRRREIDMLRGLEPASPESGL